MKDEAGRVCSDRSGFTKDMHVFSDSRQGSPLFAAKDAAANAPANAPGDGKQTAAGSPAAETDVISGPRPPAWQLLVVDDDESIHSITKLILRNARFEGIPIQMHSAYTEKEAMDLLASRPDFSMVLLDVVMEHDDTGQRIVTYLRETLGNKLVRIVLRTGQPAQAPERTVMVDYDINDYRLKTELTADRLFVTVISALRSYRDMHALVENGLGMEKMLAYSTDLLRVRYLREMSSGTLRQLASILHLDASAPGLAGGFIAESQPAGLFIEDAFGSFEDTSGLQTNKLMQEKPHLLPQNLERLMLNGEDHFSDTWFCLSFNSRFGMSRSIFVEASRSLTVLDRTMAVIFRNNLMIAYDNIQLGGEIDRTQREILFTLGDIAEARSHEVGHHIRRVSEVMYRLMLESGVTKEDADLVRIASTMHDIGKLAVPDAILQKPGRLTEDEMRLMRTHAKFGHDMLSRSNSPILELSATIALQHHERFDGTGYPSGLSGAEIHPVSRMAAIVDVFDALICKRCYKEAWGWEETIAYLGEHAGNQFDPHTMNLFMACQDDIRRIVSDYPD